MTRLFREGRTETVRPCTLALTAFVLAMEGRGPDGAELNDPVSPADRIALLRASAAAHQDQYRGCMAGRGVDRHLFALYIVSVGKKIDSPFLKAALSEPWRLSTSQVAQKQTKLWNPGKDPRDTERISPGGGFGPVADDGYGVSYMVPTDDYMFFHVSSKRSCPHTSSEGFVAKICAALNDIRALWPADGAAGVDVGEKDAAAKKTD